MAASAILIVKVKLPHLLSAAKSYKANTVEGAV